MRVFLRARGMCICVGVALLCLIGGSCDDDPPNGPNEPEPLVDYPVYFYDWQSSTANWYYIYHPLTNALDSLWLPYASPPVLSADGDLMYIAKPMHAGTAILETDSFTVVDALPYEQPLVTCQDGRFVAVADSGVYILHTSDHSVVYSDTSLFGGNFSADGRYFYGLPNAGHIRRIDLADPLFADTLLHVPMGSVYRIIPAPDNSLIYLYLVLPRRLGSHFAVLDPVGDSLIFDEYLDPGIGDLAMPPDGRFVCYTNGVSGISLAHANGSSQTDSSLGPISVYNPKTNSIEVRISSEGRLEDPYAGAVLKLLAVTPDGHWAVASGVEYLFPFIVTADLQTMEVVKYRRFPPLFYARGLACQIQPEL